MHNSKLIVEHKSGIKDIYPAIWKENKVYFDDRESGAWRAKLQIYLNKNNRICSKVHSKPSKSLRNQSVIYKTKKSLTFLLEKEEKLRKSLKRI